ncbi:MAG: cytochrome b/b6 domain-containing protein [Sneathiellaceae bacterium]
MPETAVTSARLTRHSRATRVVHFGLAISVIVQLLTSLAMNAARSGHPEDTLFMLHEYSGLAALGFVLLFWLVVTVRRTGTATARLLPWFSAGDRRLVWQDIRHHSLYLRRGALPPCDDAGPMASAIHGLGLLLMTLMAGLGTIWFALEVSGSAGQLAGAAIEVHKLFGNLAWAYLAGHTSLALLHHMCGEARLRQMLSLRATDVE